MKSLREIEAEIIKMEGVQISGKVRPSLPTKPTKPQETGKIGLIGSGPGVLSENILVGLRLLKTKPPPRFVDTSGLDAWPMIVSDALALARPDPDYSMADRAMRLGWDAKDLFGFWPKWQTWDDWCSLSVWAEGRVMAVFGENTARPAKGSGPPRYDRLDGRPPLQEIKFLWEL